MKDLIFEILKVGKWTSSNGKTHEFTENELDLIVAQYNPQLEEAPLTLGHPWLGTEPAYGWVKEVFRVGKTLYARASELCDEFIELLKEKKYKKRSVGLSKDLRLKHVAFLGAANPAVKGLSDITFEEPDDVFEFESDSEIIPSDVSVEPDSNDPSEPEPNKSNEPDTELHPNNKPELHNDAQSGVSLISDEQLKFVLNQIKTFMDEYKKSQVTQPSHLSDSESTFINRLLHNFLDSLNDEIQKGYGLPFIRSHFANILSFVSSLNLLNAEQFSDLIELFRTLFRAFPNDLNFRTPEPHSQLNDSDDFLNMKVDRDSLIMHKQIRNLMQSEKITYKQAFDKLIKE